MSNNNNANNGIAEILEVILILQQNASSPESCLDSCDKPVLGCGTTCCVCNTRPIMLYSCCASGQNAISMPISKDITTCTNPGDCSNVFRIEKLDCNAATFRVLAPNTEDTGLYPYVSTNSFFTVNLDCICSIRCLNDTCVECL